MKIDQTKRRTHRRNSGTGFTFPAATPSLIRRALYRVGNEIHTPYVWQLALHTVRGLFPRSDSSDQIGLHGSACTPIRSA